MADEKMTKAEIAAELGVKPSNLAASEAARKAKISEGFAREVEVRNTPVSKPSWTEELKGKLVTAFQTAVEGTSKAVTATMSAVVELAADLSSAGQRSGTSDSNPNRLAEDRVKQAEKSASASALAPNGPK